MKVGSDKAVPTSHCTGCGRGLDRATGIGHDTAPDPGTITICIRCGHIMAFADDMQLRDLTSEEAIGVAGDPRILAVQWARGKIDKSGNTS